MLTTVLALAFTVALLAVGWLIGQVGVPDRGIRRGVLFAFPARSVAFATLLAVQVLGSVDFAALAAVFFITQVTLLLPLAVVLNAFK
jgi:hypothetical protein